MKNKLSVFQKSPYRKRCIIENIKYYCGCLRYAWQRATKGYCYRDIWDLDHFYTQLFIDSITYFKNNLHGAPSDLYDEKNDSIEKWENYLDEMVLHFYNSLEENEVQKNEFEEEYHRLNPFEIIKNDQGFYSLKENHEAEAIKIREKWLERDKEIYDWRASELNKGLDMLKERFHDLWD